MEIDRNRYACSNILTRRQLSAAQPIAARHSSQQSCNILRWYTRSGPKSKIRVAPFCSCSAAWLDGTRDNIQPTANPLHKFHCFLLPAVPTNWICSAKASQRCENSMENTSSCVCICFSTTEISKSTAKLDKVKSSPECSCLVWKAFSYLTLSSLSLISCSSSWQEK